MLGDGFAGVLHGALAARGFDMIAAQSLPIALPGDLAARYGWQGGGARSGDLGSPRLVLQLFAEIAGFFTPEDHIWQGPGGWHDALRPGIEPAGLASPALVAQDRACYLAALRQALAQADRVILCLGRSDHREWPDHETAFPAPQPDGLPPRGLPPRVQPSHDALIADLQAIAALLPEVMARPRLLFVTSPLLAGDDAGLAGLRGRAKLLSALGEMVGLQPSCDLLDASSLIHHPAARGTWADPETGQPNAAGLARLLALFDRA